MTIILLIVVSSSTYAKNCGDLNQNEEWVRILYKDEAGSNRTIYGVADLNSQIFQPGLGGLFKIRKTFFKPKNGNKFISQAYNGKSDVKFINGNNVTTIDVLDCAYMNKVYNEERKGRRVQKLRFE